MSERNGKAPEGGFKGVFPYLGSVCIKLSTLVVVSSSGGSSVFSQRNRGGGWHVFPGSRVGVGARPLGPFHF